MSQAFLGLAEDGKTKEEMLKAIFQARMVNLVLGGAFFLPWQVQELPEEWIEAIEGLAVKVPELRKSKAKVEEAKERWRNKVNRK